jgi:hypothetical protein
MKMKDLNSKLLTFLIISSLFFLSCNNNDTVAITDPISADELITLIEADDVTDNVSNLIDDYFAFDQGVAAKSEENNPQFLSCMISTIVIEGSTAIVTLDFGDGCELPNGNVISGQIILNYALDVTVHSLTISYTYNNFFFNDLSVEGGSEIVRVRENDNGNPQSTATFDIKVTWPEGEFATRVGTKTREWIEGFDTRDWGDNVYLITGNWNTTFKDASICTATIIEPLRREVVCLYIVSGIVEISKNEHTGTIDFGDGTCDNIAVFTNELGEESEITLRGRLK